MRLIPSATILLAIFCSLPFATAVDYCQVCQDGSEISNPLALIEEIDYTCEELAEEASYYDDPIACRYYHRYGDVCGCKNKPPRESFCSLCQQNHDQIAARSLFLGGYEATCGVLAKDAAWNLRSTFTVDEDDPIFVDQDDCNFYHHIGSLCGCQHNQPPQNGCSLCQDGSQPLLSDKTITPDNAGEETCAAFSLSTEYREDQGSAECQKLQSQVGTYCGCPNNPVDESTCDFCPTGLVTKEGWAPNVQFATDKQVFYFEDATCIKVTMLASQFDFPCGSAPMDFVEGCCIPATDLLEPEVLVLQEPQIVASVEKTKMPANEGSVAERPPRHPETRYKPTQKPKEKYQINWDEFTWLSTTGSKSDPETDPPRKDLKTRAPANVGFVEERHPLRKAPHGSNSDDGGELPQKQDPHDGDVNWDEFVFLSGPDAPESSFLSGASDAASSTEKPPIRKAPHDTNPDWSEPPQTQDPKDVNWDEFVFLSYASDAASWKRMFIVVLGPLAVLPFLV